MSWSESFPILDLNLLEEFEDSATPEERAELDFMYAFKEVINPKPEKLHIASFSLFWKPTSAESAPYPAPTRELLKDPESAGIKTRFNPWSHYVQPLLEKTASLLKKYPNVTVRVHLAADLEFLANELAEAGCEVWLMKPSSINFGPGGLWRLLPFSEKGKLVTVADTDRFDELPNDLERSRAMARAGLGAWRVVVAIDGGPEGRSIGYRPLIGSQMGAMGGWPMHQLLHAFTWHCMRDTLPKVGHLPGCGVRPIPWANWPNHYADEWFLASTFYPRVAAAGVLTFAPSTAKPLFLAMDVEYCTWSNSNSQLIFFPVHSCCAPRSHSDGTEAAEALPKAQLPDDGRIHLSGENAAPAIGAAVA